MEDVMRRFTLSALVALTVLSVALSNPMQASAAAPTPLPVFMPSLSDYAPLPPVIPCYPVLAPVCETAPVCSPPAICQPSCPPAPDCQPVCPPAPRHYRSERSHEREARRDHDWRCRR
jgi:hypothetical protein